MADSPFDVIPVDVILHRDTDGPRGAYRVSRDGDAAHAVWLPKSLVMSVADLETLTTGIRQRMHMTRTVAQQKGLLAARDTHTTDLFTTTDGGQNG